MKVLPILILFFALSVAHAEDKIKMSYNNEEITKMIQDYSKASGQKFIVDPGVRGKASIYLPQPVALDEAFNHLSSALALNGFAISKQGDVMVVKSARNTQRGLIEVGTEKPTLKPERMYTWLYTFKYVPAATINRDLRILSSKDGEMSVNEATNQVIITDWVSNIERISMIFKEVDRKVDGETAKLVAQAKADAAAAASKSAAAKTEKDSEKSPK